MKGFLTSFRGRLTVLSLVTLAIALTAYSSILSAVNLSNMSSHIDEELRNRVRNIQMTGGPPGLEMDGPRGGGGIGGAGFGGPRGGGGFGGPPPNQQPPVYGDPQADVAAGIRRPRFLKPDGSMAGGFPGDEPFEAHISGLDPGQERFTETVFNGEPVRVLTVPWFRDGRPAGSLQVARELRDYQDLKHTQFLTWLMLTPLALAASALGAFMLTGKAMAPIQQMERAALKMGEGDLKTRLAVDGEDELAQLAQTMNQMAANLEKSFTDKEAAYQSLREAYESQKRFTADASHELRTPLTRLQLATSSALRGSETEYRAALETADSSAKSMARLVKELLVLARADAGQLGLRKEPIDLRLVVSDALNGFQREVCVEFPPGPVTIEGDADHLERVVANLVENAIRYTPPEKPIKVQLALHGQEAVISVADSGEGIAAEHLPRLFDRFYRADAARARADGGCGLGLAICKSVVEGHGGRITVQSKVGQGTRFDIFLPTAVN